MTELVPMHRIGTPEAPVHAIHRSNRLNFPALSFGPTPDDSVIASPMLAGALVVSLRRLSKANRRMQREMANCPPIRGAISPNPQKEQTLKSLAITYWQEHRDEYGPRYVRDDLLTFTLREAIHLTMRIRSPRRDEFIADTVDMLVERSAARWVSAEEHQQLRTQCVAAEERATLFEAACAEERAKNRRALQFSHKLEKRVAVLETAREAVQASASADGRALNAHKLTKEFRSGN